MNVAFLNLTAHAIKGVAKAFESDQLETINARGVDSPVGEVRKLIASYAIDVIVIAAIQDSEKNKPRVAEAIHQLRQTKIKQPILLLNDLQPHELTNAMVAGPIVLPLQLGLELSTGTLHVNSDILQQQSIGLCNLSYGKLGNEFEFCGFLITGSKPSKILFLGKEIPFGRKEGEFLSTLIRAKGDGVSRDILCDRLYLPDEERGTRPLDHVVKRMRNTLKAHFKASDLPFNVSEIIYSSYGDGYRLSVKNVQRLVEFFSAPATARPVVLLQGVARQITNEFEFYGFLLNRVSGDIQFRGETLKLSPIGKKLLAAFIVAEGKPLPMEKLRAQLRSAKLTSRDGALYDELSSLQKALRINLYSLGYPVARPLIKSVGGQGWRLSASNIEQLAKHAGQEVAPGDYQFSERLSYWFSGGNSTTVSKLDNENGGQSEIFSLHGFSCQRGGEKIEFHGKDVGLPRKESNAFAVMLLAEGRPVQLKAIHAAIRSPEDLAGESATNALILKSRKRLKKFLEKESHSPETSIIETVKGQGYRLSIEALQILDGPTSPAKIIRLADRPVYRIS